MDKIFIYKSAEFLKHPVAHSEGNWSPFHLLYQIQDEGQALESLYIPLPEVVLSVYE